VVDTTKEDRLIIIIMIEHQFLAVVVVEEVEDTPMMVLEVHTWMIEVHQQLVEGTTPGM